MKFGSQKAFFGRIWERLHANDGPDMKRKQSTSNPIGFSDAGVAPQMQMQALVDMNARQQQRGSAKRQKML
jgi:hypothetical protein